MVNCFVEFVICNGKKSYVMVYVENVVGEVGCDVIINVVNVNGVVNFGVVSY